MHMRTLCLLALLGLVDSRLQESTPVAPQAAQAKKGDAPKKPDDEDFTRRVARHMDAPLAIA